MFKSIFKWLNLSLISIFMASCGGGDVDCKNDIVLSSKVGYLIDSPVGNIEYSCGDKKGRTERDGKFECAVLPVEFKVGGVTILSANSIPQDKKLYLQDILNLDRDIFDDEELLKVALFLQSLDDDGDIDEYIWIDDNISAKITQQDNLKDLSIDDIRDIIKKVDKPYLELDYVKKHLQDYIDTTPIKVENNDTNQTEDKNISTPIEIDNISPTITLNGDKNITLNINNSYIEYGAKAVDNIDGNITSNIIISGDINSSKIGKYMITYSIKDSSNNEANTSREITIIDNISPIINLIREQNITLNLNENYIEYGAEAYDNIDGDISSNIIINGVVDTSKVAKYTITYNIKDSSGNEANTSREITIIDNISPAITLIKDSNITLEVNNNYIEYGAEANDNIDGNITSNIVITQDINISKIGRYIVTYSIKDSSGNEAKISREVNTIDNIAPTITLIGDEKISIENGTNYNEEGAKADDNYDKNLSIEIIGDVDTSKDGKYIIIYRVIDSSNNQAQTTREIRVYTLDTTPPSISIKGSNSTTIYKGDSYSDSGASANDNVDGTLSVSKRGSVDTNTIGTYTITYSATDSSGNSSSKSRTVKVIKATPTLDNTTLNIDENATNGTVVGNITIISQGKSDITSYDINDTTNFNISSSGEITTNSNLDYENKPQYILEVNATNGAGVSENIILTIDINNIAEVIPVLLDKNDTTTITNFTFSRDSDWVDEGNGTYSSGDIIHNQSSCIISTLDVSGELNFDWNVSSEGGCDYLNFYIDEDYQDSISGEQSMETKIYLVSSGSEIKWCYSKDGSEDDGADKSWIENIYISEYYSISENASMGDSVGFVNIKDIDDSNISYFTLSGDGSEKFNIDSNGEITLQEAVDYESKSIYHLTTTASNGAGVSNSIDVNISITNDSNDLFIKGAVFDDNSTTTKNDDKLSIYFTKDIDSGTLSTDDSFNIYGDGSIDGVGVYSSSWYHYDINMSNNSEIFGDDSNISIQDSVEASDGYELYYETITKVNNINKFSRLATGDTNDSTSNSDGDTQRGLTHSYSDNGDGTITDNNTALIWQKEDDNNTYTHSEAIDYCSHLDLGDSIKWRLPTIDELVSITDKGRVSPAINPIFTNTDGDYYWSFSSVAYYSSDAWVVYFDYGHDFVSGKDYSGLVRCVGAGE